MLVEIFESTHENLASSTVAEVRAEADSEEASVFISVVREKPGETLRLQQSTTSLRLHQQLARCFAADLSLLAEALEEAVHLDLLHLRLKAPFLTAL
ncbi:hypothetical protein KOW79_010063 [Hemibagrus wyckioides]|uniref:Uncharacterized protein n=1 Tax=Hemibagrus wyckioides TaxID=337641 RepID=A0A9D3SJS0_9TELE|nr:hypothetical protein KOW79_010063 [Hemibagrus wyckioides]